MNPSKIVYNIIYEKEVFNNNIINVCNNAFKC